MIQYRSEIDGLRAIAVLGVFFYHLHWTGFGGGWLGVDIFFVISGYLISSLLLTEIDATGTISLSGFYQRRLRRIMPALLFCLLGSFPMALIVARTHIFTEYTQSLISALLSVSNIFFWLHSGYFALEAQLAPLLHTWTLGVEEQFYLVIPLLFLLIARMKGWGRTVGFGVLFVLAVLSFMACRYGQDLMSVSFRFYMLPTRGWELFMGLITAVALHYRPQLRTGNVFTQVLSVVSLCFMLFALHRYHGGSHFAEKSFFTSLAAALFIGTASGHCLAARVLSLKPIRFVGLISYSLYLWHWPFIFLWNLARLRYGLEPSPAYDLAIVFASVFMATVSWRFVETPFRRKNTWGGCLKWLAPLMGVVALLAAYGYVNLGGDSARIKLSEEGAAHFTSFKDVERDTYYHMGPAGPPRFILIGDSHAKAASPAVVDLASEYGVPGEAAMKDGTGPLMNIRRRGKENDPPFAARWQDYVRRSGIRHVLIIAKWDRYYFLDSWKYLGSHGPWSVETAAWELRNTVTGLLDRDHDVWVLDQVPRFTKDPILLTRIFGNKPYAEDETFRDKTHFATKALAGIRSPRLHVLDPYPVLVENGLLASVRDGQYLYKDMNHLSTAGARVLKVLYRPLFEAIKNDM